MDILVKIEYDTSHFNYTTGTGHSCKYLVFLKDGKEIGCLLIGFTADGVGARETEKAMQEVIELEKAIKITERLGISSWVPLYKEGVRVREEDLRRVCRELGVELS